ncbi:hypothetical protein MRU69_10405 [Kocuria flava]|uniref:hypothetical protein n=1 Tax=Kocuria flava TaxID=446860 RepID=UPI001FF1F0C9|nr:hypothetical protein [Kocuria flava]MCJ8505268.1 hypothetical protein [Kocuria flava]
MANPVTDAEVIKEHRTNALFGAHQDNPKFGYRFLVNVIRTADKLRIAEPKEIRQIPVVPAVVGSAPLLDAETC